MLLAIIGYLFFENNKAAMKSAMNFEMMYKSRMLFSEIVLEAMLHVNGGTTIKKRDSFLRNLKHCRFDVGYYDEDGDVIVSSIEEKIQFKRDFYSEHEQYFTVTRNKSVHLGVKYIVLKESELVEEIQAFRVKID